MIWLEDIHKYYGSGENKAHVLKGASLHIAAGEFCIIYGASGSGKTTLLNVMSTLEEADSGRVKYEDSAIEQMNGTRLRQIREEYVGYIFQSYNLFNNLTAKENVMIGAYLGNNLKHVNEMLTAVDLAGHADKFPHQLSGGQQQRIAIARAIAKKPKILFCDEPTGALDTEMSWQILSLLQKLQRENKLTVVMVTHDQDIKPIANKVVYLRDGSIANVEMTDAPQDVASLREEATW